MKPPTSQPEFTPDDYPPFPDGLLVADLKTFSATDLGSKAKPDVAEAVFEACRRQGCFYLNFEGVTNHPTGQARELMRDLEGFFKMEQQEKDKYLPEDPLSLFGYKKVGGTVVDKYNKPDCAEFFNISKDDIATTFSTLPMQGRIIRPSLPWPPLMLESQALMRIQLLMILAREQCLRIVDTISEHVGMSPQTVRDVHRSGEPSGDVIRVIRGPPRSNNKDTAEEIHTPYHQDFGTVTMLFNWIGGLQIEEEGEHGGTTTTSWVKPKPDHAIVLVGTALCKFVPGCHAARHRVVSAPGAQGEFARYSMGYFLRPEDDVVLKKMTPGDEDGEKGQEQEMTAKEWIRLQARGLGIGRDE